MNIGRMEAKLLATGIGVLLGILVFIGVKTFSNVEGKNFYLWNFAIDPQYFASESKDFEAKSKAIIDLHEAYKDNKKMLDFLNSYEAKRMEVMETEPKTEVLTVVRVASSWNETSAHLKTNISSGNISVDGTGKTTEKYSVLAFNDGTCIKVTTGKLSAVRVGERVIRKTYLELICNKGCYSVEERVTYEPLY